MAYSDRVSDSLRQYGPIHERTAGPGSLADPNFDIASSLVEQNNAVLLRGLDAINIKQALKSSMRKVLGMQSHAQRL